MRFFLILVSFFLISCTNLNEPKFKYGDKVRAKSGLHRGVESSIILLKDGTFCYQYMLETKYHYVWVDEEDLELVK